MLKRLKINNFKSWSEADVKFGRITGLFGTNSSGKSSLLQFLLLLKQTRESSDRASALDLNGPLVKLGTAEDVIHAHDSKLRMAFDLEFEHHNCLEGEDEVLMHLIDNKNEARSNRAVHAELQVYNGAFRSRSLTHYFGDARFRLKEKDKSDIDFDLEAHIPDRDFSFKRTRGRPWPLPEPVKTYRFPDRARAYFTNSGFLADLEAAFEAALDKIYYLGPLRDYPQRDYLWSRSRPRDVGVMGERTIDAIVAAEDAGEKQNAERRRCFSHVVAHWLRKLELVDEFRVVEVAKGSNRWETKVRIAAGGAEVMLTDVGFGVSQVLPVIVLLHYVPEGSTVLLEQPDIHLHPLAQADLADVIIDAATRRKVQVIVESHSEHLLLRLQRRVAEEGIESEDVALYFCAVSRSESRVEPLELDSYGNIGNWPDRFMGDAFTETAEAELARLKR